MALVRVLDAGDALFGALDNDTLISMPRAGSHSTQQHPLPMLLKRPPYQHPPIQHPQARLGPCLRHRLVRHWPLVPCQAVGVWLLLVE